MLSNVILLGPMADHRFNFAPVIGKISANLALGKAPESAIDIFNPGRFINK